MGKYRICKNGLGQYWAEKQFHDTEMNDDYWGKIYRYHTAYCKNEKQAQEVIDYHKAQEQIMVVREC